MVDDFPHVPLQLLGDILAPSALTDWCGRDGYSLAGGFVILVVREADFEVELQLAFSS